MIARRLGMLAAAAAAALGLGACSNNPRLPGDQEPTLAGLRDRVVDVVPDQPDSAIAVSTEQTIAAYREFLRAAPQAPQRPEALRRLGDLEMDSADRRASQAPAAAGEIPDYRAAIARYQELLRSYPNDARNDRVLYQLARAQEQSGRLEQALQSLTELVRRYPGTVHAEEAHFRRGEMLFAMGQYQQAEAAFGTVLGAGLGAPARALPPGTDPDDPRFALSPDRTTYGERALYMRGWSSFKLGRLDDALKSFFGVLDRKLAALGPGQRDEARLEDVRALSRADRELVDDTFRVVSISLSNLAGAESVARYIDSPVRRGYEFRVYQQLGELYIRQDRIKDAADTFAAFARRQPLHAQAPLLLARVIDIFGAAGFDTLALAAKQDYVLRYGAASELRRANPGSWARAQPLVKTHLTALARHFHAQAQRNKIAGDVEMAVRWYEALLDAFPGDADAAQNRFLLAELLYEDKRYAIAAEQYERVAYAVAAPSARGGGAQAASAPPSKSAPGDAPSAAQRRAADAGYTALLSYAALEAAAPDATKKAALQRQSVASALRFARAFGSDPRSGAVLTDAAEKLLVLGASERAAEVARQALALDPPPAPELRRVAWTVVAHDSFERASYAAAEAAYGEVLALTPEGASGRTELVERQAAAIYKQGEAARRENQVRVAVSHFARVAALGGLPAGSAVHASALVDQAAALIGLKDWDAAARALEAFRRDHPTHPLQADVPSKLALAYLEGGRREPAAAEFERVAAAAQQPELARGALWQAAELREQAAEGAAARSSALAGAIGAWERYLQAHPRPTEDAVDARWRLAALTRQDGQAARSVQWLRAVQEADASAGAERTARTRALGGQARLALVAPVLEAYRKVALVAPLKRQLQLKKSRMDEVLRAYADAAEVGVLEVTTAATFHTAALYQDFGKSLLTSQRPKKLSKLEREQYDVLLEEQAFPFEEKAIELYETNARRTAAGQYDPWIRRSLEELARLKPVRYRKAERGDASLGSDVPALQAALKQTPGAVALLNQLGIAERQQGHFERARLAYVAAIAADPAALAPYLNLAILYDLYLGDVDKAQVLYRRCVELSPGDATQLNSWLAELKTRKPAPPAPTEPAAPATAAPAAPASGASHAPPTATQVASGKEKK